MTITQEQKNSLCVGVTVNKSSLVEVVEIEPRQASSTALLRGQRDGRGESKDLVLKIEDSLFASDGSSPGNIDDVENIAEESVDLNRPCVLTEDDTKAELPRCDDPTVDHVAEATTLKGHTSYSKNPHIPSSSSVKDCFDPQLGGTWASKFPLNRMTITGIRLDTHYSRPFQIINRHIPAITTLSILRGAWALTIARHLENNDVVFGSTTLRPRAPVPRPSSGDDPTIVTVPLHVKIHPSNLVTEFLLGVQNISEDIIPYEQPELQNITNRRPTALDACSFSNHLVVELSQTIYGTDGAASAYERLKSMSIVGQDNDTCPLVVQCIIGGQGGVEVFCHFDERVVALQQVHLIYSQFEHVACQLSSQEKLLISEVNVFSPHDLRQILQWNKPKESERVSACVQDLISSQAHQRPEHEAIQACDGRLTYAELEKLSNRLALHLILLGVRPELMVAICFEKTKWAVVAMLAIMKAGGAFMPLDPAHPTTRHLALLQKVGVQILITSPEATPSCATAMTHTVTMCDDFIARLPDLSSSEQATFASRCSSNNVAYIMFTSGSTGEPKGMVVEQGSLCSSIMGHGRAYGLVPASRVLQFSSFTFDSSLSEILTPLVFGGTVCMPSDTERLQDCAKFMRGAKVDVAILTPSFASTLKPDEIPAIRTLVLSGEVISKDQLKTWCGRVKLINAYGPSEVCIDCTAYVFKSPDDFPTNIGFAHSGTCWIVEAENHDRLAPVGCIGELLVQGPALARGYFGDKDRTRASFLDSVQWQRQFGEARDRLYKTGDLVKYNYDGSIEYIGRKDTQVKLRGQRLELGEVEYNIRKALPSVEHVVVELVKRESHQLLIAFFAFRNLQSTGNQNQSENSESSNDLSILQVDMKMRAIITKLIADLRIGLPNCMVPTQFLPLKRMPFVSSMKIDRKQLRAWAGDLSAAQLATFSLMQNEFVAPTTQTENVLRDLWADTLRLKVDAIGKNDTFLRLGGDSISAIQLVSRARQRGISLTVASILKDGKLSQIAAIADDAADAANDSGPETTLLSPFSLLPSNCLDNMLRRAREQCGLTSDQVIEDAYPCTSMQKGLMDLATRQPTSSIVRYIYRLAEQVDLPRFKRAWNQVLLDCANLRTRIVFVDENPLQVVLGTKDGWDSDIRDVDLTSAMDGAGELSMGYGSQLCHYALAHGRDGHTYFIWTMHYTILDPWSGDLMRQKLHSAYHGTVIPKLQPYNQLFKYIADLDNDRCSAYWENQLQGAKRTMLPLQDQRSNFMKPILRGDQFIRYVSRAISFTPTSISSITRATVLRGAWALALAKYCSTNDVCFGTSISGRNAPIPGLHTMVGLVPTIVPVRIRFNLKQTASSYLHDIQAQASEMAPFEQYGLEKISRISVEAHAACDFSSMLIIQPAQLLNSAADSDSIMLSVGEDLDGYYNYPLVKGYFMYPLVVQILVHEDCVKFDAVYDADTVLEEEVIALSNHFKDAVHLLHSPNETTLINDFFAD